MFLQLDPDTEYEYHAPTQAPINPPYMEACHLKKHNQLAQPVAATSGGSASINQRLQEPTQSVSDDSGNANSGETSDSEKVTESGNEPVVTASGDSPDCNQLIGATGVDVEKLSLQDT